MRVVVKLWKGGQKWEALVPWWYQRRADAWGGNLQTRGSRWELLLSLLPQESRVSKAVEVMIQHVENLKRMYAKEHAELEELKQVLLQNERSFSSLGDRGNQEKPLSPCWHQPARPLQLQNNYIIPPHLRWWDYIVVLSPLLKMGRNSNLLTVLKAALWN